LASSEDTPSRRLRALPSPGITVGSPVDST
jgi:hypothetical protein